MLRSDELGAVLASLGAPGDAQSRLSAVVALLVNSGNGQVSGGAFANSAADMTSAFTSGLHNCLRGETITACPEPINASRLRKQC